MSLPSAYTWLAKEPGPRMLLAALALVNLVGPRLVERSEGLLNVCKLLILGAFIVAGLASPALTLERLGPTDWVGPVDIVAGGMVVFSFIVLMALQWLQPRSRPL